MAFRKLAPGERITAIGQQPQPQAGGGEPSGFTGLLRTLASPFRKTLGSGFELGTSLGERLGLGRKQDVVNPFLGQQGLQELQQAPVKQSLKNLAGISSFFVPGGVGKNILTKAILPGAVSASLFETGQRGATPTSVAKSAGIGGVTGGALNLLGKGFGKIKGFFGGAKTAIQDKSLNAVIGASASQADDFISRRGVTTADALRNLVGKSGRGATSLDDLVGSVAQRGRGGIIDDVITAAESQIDDALRLRGEGVILSGDDIIARLTQRRAQLASTLGNESKVAQLDDLIQLARTKYAQGTNPRQALATVRAANSAWGKAQTLTGKEAVAKQVGIEEADVLREALKNMFPDIADALDTQADGLALQGLLNRSRGKGVSGKINLGALDITRPGSAIDKVVGQPGAATRLGGIAGAPPTGPAGVPLPTQPGRLQQLLGGAGTTARANLPAIGAGQTFGQPETPRVSQLLQTGGAPAPAPTPGAIPGLERLSEVLTPEILAAAVLSGDISSADVTTLQSLGIVEKPKGAIERRKDTELQSAAGQVINVVSSALKAPSGVIGSFRATTGRLPGVSGGEAERLRRDTRGLAKSLANIFAAGEARVTDEDIERWLELMPKPGDTRSERIERSQNMVNAFVDNANVRGIAIPPEITQLFSELQQQQ
ncbi:MAG TPA: hypothetical protein ENI23_11545 [bacterium]|nr:hypothetical protein [bacterium]